MFDASGPVSPPPRSIELSEEQKQVLDKVKAGHSVFFSGSAGTGKSLLLREIIKWCRNVGTRNLAVTASTGIAARSLDGSSLHAWAGIRLGIGDAYNLAVAIRTRAEARLAFARRQREAQRRAQKSWLFDPPPAEDDDGDSAANYEPLKNWLDVQVL